MTLGLDSLPLHVLGELIVRIELRQVFRSNGLIDDLLVYSKPQGYQQLADVVAVSYTHLTLPTKRIV